MKEYFVLDIFEYCDTYSYAFDNLEDLLNFLFRYAKDNSSDFNYFIYKTWLNKEKFNKLNITIPE